MANFNSTASQILNGTANFLNGVSNAARDVIVNPAADLINLGLKTNPVAAAANLATKGKVNKAIDTVTSAAKGEQPHSLQRQPEDPTSMAYAVGEGLTKGVDQAAAVISLAEAARQLPKVAQAGWNKILSKVSAAKTKNEQMKLAKEARDYIDKHATNTIELAEDVPAYQRRAAANAANAGRSATDPKVEKFTGQYYKDQSMKTFDNLTSKMKDTDNVVKDWPKDLRKTMREGEVLEQIQKQDSSYKYLDPKVEPNRTYVNLSKEQASKLGVPYRKWTRPTDDIFADAVLRDEKARAKELGTTVDTLKELAYSNNMTTKDFYDMLKKNGAREWEEYMKAGETGEKFKQAMKKNRAKERAFRKQVEADALADAEAEAADIAAGERAYKHEGVDPTIWF